MQLLTAPRSLALVRRHLHLTFVGLHSLSHKKAFLPYILKESSQVHMFSTCLHWCWG